MNEIAGPFGAAKLVDTFPTCVIAQMYRAKCGYDVGPHFGDTDAIDLFECTVTGYRFWRPASVAGDESFYRGLSAAWSHYYRDWRWEYGPALRLLQPGCKVLEVGSGRGYFLKLTEERVTSAVGLELNQAAIADKVTRHPIYAEMVEECARKRADSFDIVYSFQVLEHVVNPASFIESCVTCTKPNGLIVLSTPNIQHRDFARRKDAFDLPPHHIGHFSPKVYRRIAHKYGLTLQSVVTQPRFMVAEGTRAKNIAKRILNGAYHWLYGPGACVLAVYRKKPNPA